MDWHCAVNTLCVVKSWWKSNSFCRAWRPSFGAQEKSSGRIRRDSAESGSWLWTSDIAARSASGLTMSLGGAEDIYTFGVNKCNQSVDKFQHKCWRRDRDSILVICPNQHKHWRKRVFASVHAPPSKIHTSLFHPLPLTAFNLLHAKQVSV